MDNTEIKVVRDTGFGQVKRSVMRDKSLSIEAKAIYAYFCGFAGNDTKAYPLRDTIVEELGISLKRYYKYLKELQARGIIKIQTIKTDSGFKRNIYYINDCSPEPCSQNNYIGSSQNDHIGSSQNDHVVGSQNDHIEYKQRIITKNNTPPISPQGGNGVGESQNENIDFDIKDTEKTESHKSKKEVKEDTPEEKVDKAINAITKDKDIKKVIKDFAGNDLEMIDALKGFYKSRSKLKKPLTARAFKLNLKELKRLSEDPKEQLAIIDQTIQKGWQSFYELPVDHPYQEEKSMKENAKYGYVF
ncbi:MAG: helix-turn-helix domain-containing protein [Peptoniphilus senegalensis]